MKTLLRPSDSSNCEENYDRLLLLPPEVTSNENTQSPTKIILAHMLADAHPNYYDIGNPSSNSSTCSEIVSASETTPEDCANIHYAGYLLKVLLKKFDCSQCERTFSIDNVCQLEDKKQLYILHKSYGSPDNITFLKVPSVYLENIVSLCMSEFKKYFENSFLLLVKKLVITNLSKFTKVNHKRW